MNLRKLFIRLWAVLFLLLPLSLSAAHYEVANRLQGTNISTSNSITLTDGFWQAEEKNNQSNYRSHRLTKVSLIWGREDRTDVDVQAGTTSGVLTVEYTVDFTKNGTYLYSKTDELTIQASDSEPIYSAVKLYDADADQITVKIISVSTTGAFASSILSDVRFEAAIDCEIYRYLDPTQQTSIDYDATDKVLGWTFVPGAEEYEVEWAWIDEHSTWPQNRIFEAAPRIRTSQQWYAPDLTYRPGKIYFRVRPIGRFVSNVGDDYSIKKYGAWSEMDSITVDTNSAISMERDKNLQYTMTFSEEGVYKKVLSYFDGSMRPRQALTNLSSDGTTVITQSEYDMEGRATITTLPFPEEGLDLSWRDNVNRKTATDPWLPMTTDTIGDPVAMVNNSGASKYYSSNNGFSGVMRDYIPDAGGYAYTQVEFISDHTGRVKRQGGVGPDHKIGSGHDVQFFYGNATTEELIRLFGSNVGAAGHYSKVMQIDPNGQVSVSWQSMAGQTVASALAGQAPENLIALNSVDNDRITVDLMGNNHIDRDALTSTSITEILNTNIGNTYNFFYDMKGVIDYADQPFDFCEDCEYELRIFVRDPNGDLVSIPDGGSNVDTLYREYNYTGSLSGCTANGPYNPPTLSFNLTFNEIGDYTIVKEIRVVKKDYQAVWDQLTNLSGAPNLQNFIDYARANIDTTLCDETCIENVTSYLQAEFGHAPTQSQIDSAVVIHCGGEGLDSLMYQGLERECDGIYQALLNDFRPGGWLYDANVWASVSGDPAKEDSLVQTHREYCHYTQCQATLDSRLHDLKMALPATYTDAAILGYNDPLSGGGIDPWFASGGQGQYMASEMDTWLDTYTDFINVSTGGAPWSWDVFHQPVNVANTLDLYASCGGSPTCEDSLRWQIQRGVYADQKMFMQSIYVQDSLGCPYYQDNHAIVQNPGQLKGQDLPSFTAANMSSWCAGTCQGNVDEWMQYLVDSCGVSAGDTAVENTLLRYCMSHCGSDNPFGLILEADSLNGDLADLMATLVSYGGCDDELDSLVQTSPYQYQIENGDTVMVACDQLDPCLSEILNLVNSSWTSNGMPSSLYFGDNPILMNCYGPDDHFDWNGNQLIVGTPPNHCVALDFSVSGSVSIPDSLSAITDPYLDGSGNLISTLWFAATDTTQSSASATLTVPTSNGCRQFSHIQDSCYAITGLNYPEFDLPEYTVDSCREDLRRWAENRARDAWNQQMSEFVSEWLATHTQECLEHPFWERFEVEYKPMEYHYTLYYYDQSGNLVQTVPPEGVEPLGATEIAAIKAGTGTPADEPTHRMKTKYQHNSVEQVVWASTPDGGESEFWYNKKHQLRFSQDARQEANDWYSYSKYDALGRVTEVGRLDNFTNPITDTELADLTFPDRSTYLLKDITTTVWDEDVLYGGTWQENLRMRIAAVFRETDEGTYTARHFYSYDDHGNVDDYRVQLPGLGIKRMEYDYDLVSGNVLEVRYQQGELDFWAHRYQYDSDNRIQEAWTSRNGVIWDRDARYQFYAHGPLARTEIGEDGVQGLDHYYSIHGWIKGVNVAGGFDPGEDGRVPGSSENRWMGRDEMAFGLAFYEGDYDAIGGVSTGALDNAWTKAETNGDILTASGNGWDAGLYNGNIPWMVTELNGNGQVDASKFAVSGLQGVAYKYDQLQRLKRAISYRDYASNWNSASTGLYETDYTFDANGNLQSLNRWAYRSSTGARAHMDDFSYQYDLAGGEKTDNRLRHVNDAQGVEQYGAGGPTGPWTWFDNDLDDQGGYSGSGGNYTYDEIGNLTKDVHGEIDTILWDNYGKIEAVERVTAPGSNEANLYFEYDGTGNRIAKHVILTPNSTPVEKTSYYVRDPQGNVMAVYDVYEEEEQIITELEELTIYGSDRLGTCHAGTILNEVGVDAGPSSVGNKGVIFAEVMYDSPLTGDPAGKTVPPEVNRGEYFVLWNTTPDTVDMGDYQVENLVNSETVTFSEMVLPPFQWLLVANADSVEDLQLVTALPWNTLNDNTVQTKLTTEFTMSDDKGQLVLSYTSTSEVIDQVDYGSLSGLVATNAYVEENNLDSLHLRVPLKAIQREEISKPAIGFDPANFGTGDLEVQVEPVYNQDWFTSSHERRPGCKVYEMKNHLGNVLATVSDWKIGADTSVAGSVADYYLAQVRSLTDYLPFGMEMPGREFVDEGYRYGFNGKISDSQWSGDGNSYDYGFRIYHPQIGRFLSVDPLSASFPWWTPFQFAGNKPIQAIDLDGLESVNYQALPLPNGQTLMIDVNNSREVEMYDLQVQAMQQKIVQNRLENAHQLQFESWPSGDFSLETFNDYWKKRDAEMWHMLYCFSRDFMPISGPIAQSLEAEQRVALGTGKRKDIAWAYFWLAVDLATMGEGSGPAKGAQTAGKTKTLFRFVGPDELADIFQSGLIRPGNGSMETKLFSSTLDDAITEALHLTKEGEQFAIIKIEVAEGFVEKLFKSGSIDAKVLKGEVYGVGIELVEEFNKNIDKFFSSPMFKRTKDGMEVIK